MKKRFDFSRLTPPGMDMKTERYFLIFGGLASFLFSFVFFVYLTVGINGLYNTVNDRRILIDGAIMPDFIAVLGNSLIAFAVIAACLPAFVVLRYRYFYTESKSIYLMKRLPSRTELHRRCLTVPALELAAACLAVLLLMFIYLGVYMLAVPDECIAPEQFLKIWRVLLS